MDSNFIQSLKQLQSFKDTIEEYLEMGIDSLIKNDMYKQIPVVKTIVGSYNFVSNFQEVLFTKKLMYFLNELNDIPQEKVINEIIKIEDSEKYQSKVGNKLLEILDKLDSDFKPQILGKLFRLFLRTEISYTEFLKMADLLNKAFYYDLFPLKEYDKYDYIYIEVADDIENLGLCSNMNKKIRGGWKGTEEEEKSIKAKFEITRYGKIIAQCL